jgi:hypothetical protein
MSRRPFPSRGTQREQTIIAENSVTVRANAPTRWNAKDCPMHAPMERARGVGCSRLSARNFSSGLIITTVSGALASVLKRYFYVKDSPI